MMTVNSIDVRACCVCHSIYRPHREEWVQVGEPLYKEIMKQYNVSHGYCAECYSVEREKLRQSKLERLVRQEK